MSDSTGKQKAAPEYITFTKKAVVWAIITGMVTSLIIAFCVFAYTPLKTFIPGYPDERTRVEAITNTIRIDSLENEISHWRFYMESLRLVMEGKEASINLDSLFTSTGIEE